MHTYGYWWIYARKSIVHLVCTFSLWTYCMQFLWLWSSNKIFSNFNTTESLLYQTVVRTVINTDIMLSTFSYKYTSMHTDTCVFKPILMFILHVCVLCFHQDGGVGKHDVWDKGNSGWVNSELIVVIILCSILGPPTFPRSTWSPLFSPPLIQSHCPSTGPCSRAGRPQGSRVPAV